MWDAMRAHAYRNGSAFTIGSVQLWGGYTQYLRGDLGEAESELRASLETVAFWGMPTQAQWQSPILAEILVERGAARRGPRPSRHGHLPASQFGPRDPGRPRLHAGAAGRGAAGRGARIRRRVRAPCRVEASPTLCALAVTQGAGARRGSAGMTRRLRWRARSSRSRVAGDPRVPSGARYACSAPSCAPTGSSSSRRRAPARAGAGAARAGEGARRAAHRARIAPGPSRAHRGRP